MPMGLRQTVFSTLVGCHIVEQFPVRMAVAGEKAMFRVQPDSKRKMQDSFTNQRRNDAILARFRVDGSATTDDVTGRGVRC
ncbi:hypothetical protein HCU01_00530 [Halomonas cupida]|uniref:Uncharacterized protein n=2 Tax=Halomonas cupida TaxID=44933 RepID=A0ABQ0W8R3_9GAMM|nr:hypothetical protein HCU01_00530 [Halomonas cupida]